MRLFPPFLAALLAPAPALVSANRAAALRTFADADTGTDADNGLGPGGGVLPVAGAKQKLAPAPALRPKAHRQ